MDLPTTVLTFSSRPGRGCPAGPGSPGRLFGGRILHLRRASGGENRAIRRSAARRRRGAILPILVVSLLALLAFVALAIDIGMLAVARSQCQNASDAAAMAGARALNGDSSSGYNVSGATPRGVDAATSSTIQSRPITPAQVNIKIGSYTYDYNQARFVMNVPGASSDTPNLVTATVTASGQNIFGRLLGAGTFNVTSTATAVHRPRDVAVVLDLSGSMRFDSLLGIPYFGSRTQSNNPETVYPLFGHYSSTSAGLQNSTGPDMIGGDTYGLSNVTVATDAGDAIVRDFYQNALGATPAAAFTAASDAYATAPGGDCPLVKYHASTYGQTVQQITNGATFKGYTATPFTGYSGPTVDEYNGYTQGPRHWGKTFFIWPPDPRAGKDWRKNYFNYPGTNTGIDDNTRLWDSSGNWRAPGSTTYSIDYSAILSWIKQSPNPFPPRLRAGRILFYDAIPSSISTSSYPPSDPNQRFWKEYIDYVLGVYQKNSSTYDVITKYTGYGDDYAWGTVDINDKPSGTGVASYMDYRDNPKRPKLHFWFGPMTMIDFLGNYNMWSQYSNWNPYWPGNCHEGPLWACKLGVQAAMKDVQNNHPNDFVSLIYFSTPKYTAGDGGSFNRVRVPLGRDYQRLSDTLWFPPSTIDSPGTEIRPYDSDNLDTPRAYGGTTTVMGLMLAYNQFSGNSSLRNYAPSPAPYGEAGGLGRRGAQRLVILQTDGMANNLAAAAFNNSGTANSYYKIRQPGEYPSYSGSSVTSQLYAVASQICALETDSPPGYSTARKPVLIHCLALGPLFDPGTSNSSTDDALALLQNIQYIGGTQSSPVAPLAPYKIITGTSQQRIDRIRQAFSAIMQDGVQVSLIE